MKPIVPLVLLALTLATPAVLHAQDTTGKAPKIRRHPDLISQQEVEALPPEVRNAHEIVVRLRPNWFTTHGQGTLTQAYQDVVTYVNEIRRGGPLAIKDVDRLQVLEIRHLRGHEASTRFGMNHEHGAVLVKLK